MLLNAQEGVVSIKKVNEKFYENGTNLSRAEVESLKLLETNSSPSDKAIVYLAIATKYANSDFIYPEKTTEYCKLALEYPQGTLNACHLYSMLGGAIESQYHTNLNNKEFYLATRKAIIKPYLDALAIIESNQVPEIRQSRPRLDFGTIERKGPDTSEFQAKVKEHNEQIAAIEKVDLVNSLIDYREQITADISRYYRRKADNLDELRESALQEFNNNTNAVDEFIKRVKQNIAPKSQP